MGIVHLAMNNPVAFATFGLCFLTLLLFGATAALASVEWRKWNWSVMPRVVARISTMEHHGGFYEIQMANLGAGDALDFRFKIEPNARMKEVMGGFAGEGNWDHAPRPYLRSKETVIVPLCGDPPMKRLLEIQPEWKPWSIEFEYRSVRGKVIRETQRLDLNSLGGIRRWGDSLDMRKMTALEGINKNLRDGVSQLRKLASEANGREPLGSD